MPPVYSKPAFNEAYYAGLIGSARERYQEKVKLCDDVDPYTLRPGADTTMDVNAFPEVSHGDIVNYLVFSSNFTTLEEMKAYKSLESHNYFTSGWVKTLSAKRLQGEKVLLLGEVNHSQRLGERPLKVWILCKDGGAVLTAHCTCMAGVGEACSHVGACLFAVDTGVRMRNSVSCTQKDNIWLPTYVEKAQFKRLKEINFASAKGKKRQLDDRIEGTPTNKKATAPRIDVPPVSLAEMEDLHSICKRTGVVPAFFSMLSHHSAAFKEPVPKQQVHLRDLYTDDALPDGLDTLIDKANKFMSTFHVTDEAVKFIEAKTKNQSNSPDWHLYRAGRVTASVMKTVCRTAIDNPSLSLLKSICYPEKYMLKTPAMAWGLEHERDALKTYEDHQKKKHKDFKCFRSGLHLSESYPFAGAIPDALISCSCCGRGVAEVKCPYLLRDASSFTEARSCLMDINGVLQLPKQHEYFYQVQAQMTICKVSYCDFIVWAPDLFHVHRIRRDKEFCDLMFANAKEFFIRAILPELFSKFFTRKQGAPQKELPPAEVYCFCQGPETGKMIACDNPSCTFKWFHFSCVGITRAPKAKKWHCPLCKQNKEN
ncbi:uncharacterized protein [Dermacentor albipictus]|uniref:uncharacterized protein n=1 Tax=Dermacentor albipictus TaxID=60249 RepID=UPI0038FD0056